MLNIVLGAGGKAQDGWLSTDKADLDLLRPETWPAFGLEPGTVDAFLAEHVWEHLSPDDGQRAAMACHDYLRPGGHLRLAVPDGLFPSQDYIDWVRPGGTGPGCDTHHILYDYRSLSDLLKLAGFDVRLLEWWDTAGTFHRESWDEAGGYVERCAANDPRNQDGVLRYTSLIADGVKP